MKIIKFALPLAALICFTAVAPLAVAADSKKRSSSSATARKKSATSKKSSKSSKGGAKSRKTKGKSSTAKKKQKTERRTAKAETSSIWIDDLPEVELPTLSGPAEEELLEEVDTEEVEIEPEGESDPEP